MAPLHRNRNQLDDAAQARATIGRGITPAALVFVQSTLEHSNRLLAAAAARPAPLKMPAAKHSLRPKELFS
jgi:primosomal replication protein N